MFGSHKVRARFVNSHPTVVGHDASIPESERLSEKPTTTEPTNDGQIPVPEFTSPFAIAQRVTDDNRQQELMAQTDFSEVLDAYLSPDSIVSDGLVFSALKNYLLAHGAGNPDGVSVDEALEFTSMLAFAMGRGTNPLRQLDTVGPAEAVNIVRGDPEIGLSDQQITLGQETTAWVIEIFEPNRVINAQAGTIK